MPKALYDEFDVEFSPESVLTAFAHKYIKSDYQNNQT